MSIETHIVVASSKDAQTLADSDSPTLDREGFTFTGFDRVQVCTLLSLLATDNHESAFERYLDAVNVIRCSCSEWPVVSVLNTSMVAELAKIASMDESEFDYLADAWAETEEFEGWSPTDLHDLLHDLGDLADSAAIQKKCIMIWQSP
jgi:predicted metal-binding protein